MTMPMWLLLWACTGDADDSAAPDPVCEGADRALAGCCFYGQGHLQACATELESTAPLQGQFSADRPLDGGMKYSFSWDEDGTTQQTPLWLWIPDFLDDVVPALDSLGTVVLENGGGCDIGGGTGGEIFGAFVVRDTAGALLLAVGNANEHDLGEVAVLRGVDPPEGETTCEAVPEEDGCFGSWTNLWTAFTSEGEEIRLLPGQSGEVGSVAVTLVSAHTSDDPRGCLDAGGSAANWLVLPR